MVPALFEAHMLFEAHTLFAEPVLFQAPTLFEVPGHFAVPALFVEITLFEMYGTEVAEPTVDVGDHRMWYCPFSYQEMPLKQKFPFKMDL